MYRCGAKLRDGQACRRAVRYPGGKCSLHSGATNGDRVRAGLGIASVLVGSVLITLGSVANYGPFRSSLLVSGAILGFTGLGLGMAALSARLRRNSIATEEELQVALGVAPLEVSESATTDEGEKKGDLAEQSGPATGDPTDIDDELGVPAQTRPKSAPSHGSGTEVGLSYPLANLIRLTQRQSDGNARIVTRYYAQGHIQASSTFIISMIVALIGFALAVTAIYGYISNPDDVTGPIVTGAVSAVTEVVGFLFFRRADAARQLMIELIDRLRTDRADEQKAINSLILVDEIRDTCLQDAVRAALIIQLGGLQSSLEAVQLTASKLDEKPEHPRH